MTTDHISYMERTFSCDLDKIKIFEICIGCKLPKDYRLFLQSVNGGIPIHRFFCSVSQDDVCSILSVLFGITSDKNNDLIHAYKRCSGSIPDDMIPIGHDQGGNDLLLCVKGSDYGKIYFLDHEKPITFISNSFDEFINGLRSEDEIEELKKS